MIIQNNCDKIVKLNGYDVQKEQLLHPSSIIGLISFLRVLLLKMFKVFTDVKSGGNFRHNLGPRSGLSRMLPTTISADWKIVNNPDTPF